MEKLTIKQMESTQGGFLGVLLLVLGVAIGWIATVIIIESTT